jgi:hypothetical protein
MSLLTWIVSAASGLIVGQSVVGGGGADPEDKERGEKMLAQGERMISQNEEENALSRWSIRLSWVAVAIALLALIVALLKK